jgi:hypothetical protein
MSTTLNYINEKVSSATVVQRKSQKKLHFSSVVQISLLILVKIAQVECIWLSHAIGGPSESP